MTPKDLHTLAEQLAALPPGFMRHYTEGEPIMPPAVAAAHALAAKVDRLGALAAQVAALELDAAKIRTELEAAGLREILGQNYRASFSQVKGATRIDWKTIAAKFKPSRQLIAAHTTTGKESTRMNLTAHPTH
jgi:hypothetical protein